MIKLGVIFGGMSTEHEVSVVSATSIIENLNKSKYEIYPIYISKQGNWYKYTKQINKIKTLKIGEKIEELDKIDNVIEYLKQLNCIFPVLHGLYGEDGTIQGLFELLKIPYIGCKVMSSSISMDKVYTKALFEKAGFNQAKYEYIQSKKENYIYIDKQFNEQKCTIEKILEILTKEIEFPMFVKPSNSGSSVGITKVHNIEELKEGIVNAQKYDRKIIIEQAIEGREIECAVLENEDVIASCLGEVLSAENYYSFNSKYNNEKSKTQIPANVSKDISEEIKKLAIKAFKTVDGRGISRVDFFIEKNTNKIYINEINTMPGFTTISMYPKLFENDGIKYSELIDNLVNSAIKK